MESAPRALDVMSWSRLPDHSIMEIMTKVMMVLMMVMMVMVMMMMRVADALRASGCNELVTLARPCPPGGVNTAQDGDHYHDDEIHHDDGDHGNRDGVSLPFDLRSLYSPESLASLQSLSQEKKIGDGGDCLDIDNLNLAEKLNNGITMNDD